MAESERLMVYVGKTGTPENYQVVAEFSINGARYRNTTPAWIEEQTKIKATERAGRTLKEDLGTLATTITLADIPKNPEGIIPLNKEEKRELLKAIFPNCIILMS